MLLENKTIIEDVYINRTDFINLCLIFIALYRHPFKYIGLINIFLLSQLAGLISFLGWEWCWAVGYSSDSTCYSERFIRRFPSGKPTYPNSLHAYFNCLGDGCAIIWIFYISSGFKPKGLLQFNFIFWLISVLLGIVQNVLITLCPVITPYQPQLDTLSWSPLAGNVTCDYPDSKICFKSQKPWIIYVTFVYFIFLLGRYFGFKLFLLC